MRQVFHPVAWLAWLVGVMTPVLLTRNPLYQGVVLAALILNLWAWQEETPSWVGWRAVLRLAGWLVLFSVGVNVLTVHYGEHVWATLPREWPLIGGPLTLEALMFGVGSALSLLSLLLLFALFNLGMPPSRWLRLVPGFLFQAGVVTSIAVTFVPATVQAARDTYDAQRLRGHRFRRLIDYAPLFAPVLVDSLERSVQLAESMAARGFGANLAPISERRHVAMQAGIWLGLLSLLVGLFARTYWAAAPVPWGNALIVVGVSLLACVFWLQGQRVRRTRYRRWYWRPRDTLLLLGSLVLFGVSLGVRSLAPQVWLYYPYPPYDVWPTFAPVPGLFLLLAGLPALLAPPPPVESSRAPAPGPQQSAPPGENTTSRSTLT